MMIMAVDPGTYLAYLAPAVVVVGGARGVAYYLWNRFEKKLDESRDEVKAELAEAHGLVLKQVETTKEEQAIFQESTAAQLHNILEQTTRTNGRVSELELKTTKLEGILEGEDRVMKRSTT